MGEEGDAARPRTAVSDLPPTDGLGVVPLRSWLRPFEITTWRSEGHVGIPLCAMGWVVSGALGCRFESWPGTAG